MFFASWKKPTTKSQQSTQLSVASHGISAQFTAASQGYRAQTHRLSKKMDKEKVCTSINHCLVSSGDAHNQKRTNFTCKKKGTRKPISFTAILFQGEKEKENDQDDILKLYTFRHNELGKYCSVDADLDLTFSDRF